MATTFTIDASVFLTAFNPYDPEHEASRQLLSKLQAEGAPIIVPTLLMPEVAAAAARGRNDSELALRFAISLRQLPHVVLVSVSQTLAVRAADLAAEWRLRGSDAVYVAVAQRFGSTLVTLDKEQRSRVATVIPTRFPAEALAEQAIGKE